MGRIEDEQRHVKQTSDLHLATIEALARAIDAKDQMTQSHIDYMLSKIPMGRLIEPEEVAAMICWLASEDISATTAAVFDITGGRSTY
jgi:NAD(P)-dependent dehydrogenase (short-subunit alcohol dehydrogenase family)